MGLCVCVCMCAPMHVSRVSVRVCANSIDRIGTIKHSQMHIHSTHSGGGNDGYYNLQKQHSTSSGNGGNSNNVVNSEGYSYVNDVPSLQSSHHRHSTSSSQQKSTSSSSHRDYQQPNRTRRTQRRVTHNEKRYHSGQH